MLTGKVSVSSSNIESIDYDDETYDLFVTFKGGRTYVYHEVALSVYRALMEAESKGTFLNKFIKGVFEYTKV